jgi:hypothetical protein
MNPKFNHINYKDLNARQKESYNFQKVSAVLADYGFATIRLSDDWQGADFIAQHHDGITFIKVQLKGRLTFAKKYEGKDLWVCFPYKGEWYFYPHDELLQIAKPAIQETKSWKNKGAYDYAGLSVKQKEKLEHYKL